VIFCDGAQEFAWHTFSPTCVILKVGHQKTILGKASNLKTRRTCTSKQACERFLRVCESWDCLIKVAKKHVDEMSTDY